MAVHYTVWDMLSQDAVAVAAVTHATDKVLSDPTVEVIPAVLTLHHMSILTSKHKNHLLINTRNKSH